MYVLLAVGALISLYPLLFMLSTSLQPMTVVFEYPPKLFAGALTWDNFEAAWASRDFSLYLVNSLFVTAASLFIIALLSSLLAFAYSRFEFAGKRASFAVLLGSLVIPGLTLVIPQFVMMHQLGLDDTFAGLITVYAAGAIPFTTFLLKGFFDSISREIDESIAIDGGSSWTMYWRMVLPLSKPAFVPAIIFNVLSIWEEFPWALTIISDPAKRTLPIALANFQGQYTTQWGVVFAGSLIAVVPIIAVFLLLQRFFVQGIMAGAVKG
ncbi:carbohydrate ABC transporter permease [Cohnella fermenti]|uniref:Carbohydrate ABC transporter permease n=2 Tax=Cohnella fermenti TaxID=2565925 RepID=A0A4S4C3E7_9BACL|nr:carbohydrate ABC transporter permease [Cohnella fermenti]